MATKYPSTAAITKALCSLGFRNRTRTSKDGVTNYKEFWVAASTNSAGERIYNRAHFYGNRETERAWELREEIERLTAEAGSPFYVRKYQLGSYVMLEISNRYQNEHRASVDLPFGRVPEAASV